MKLQTLLGDYNMNILKIALLGTAAVAAVSVSARADNLSDLKAQIEMLNARVASLEVAPAVPAGFSMVAISKGMIAVPGGQFKDFAHDGTMISIMPTADAPAAASTSFVWTGNVKAAVVYSNDGIPPNYSGIDIQAKSGLNVTGKTDTAVGEVGVSYSMAASWASDRGLNAGGKNIGTDGVKGWWKMTQNLTLMAGQFGSISGNGKGYDGSATANFGGGDVNGGYGTPTGGDPAQMQLAYSDGPIGFAVAVEDSDNANPSNSAFGFAAEATYAGDMFSAELNAGAYSDAHTTGQDAPVCNTVGPIVCVAQPIYIIDTAWTINAGVKANLGDMASLSVAAGVGSGNRAFDDYTKASALLNVKLGDSAHAELGISQKWNTQIATSVTSVGGGIYYDPVKQLTMGLEAGWNNTGGFNPVKADLVTVFRF
jgi:hypothetical protein